MAVQVPDGTEAYTRRGDLRIGATGVLETGDGFPVIGEGGPITVPPANKVEIGADGTVSIQPQGADATEVTQIGRIKLVTGAPARLKTGPDNLMRPDDGRELPQYQNAPRQTGSLESSHANRMDEMVHLTEQTRPQE